MKESSVKKVSNMFMILKDEYIELFDIEQSIIIKSFEKGVIVDIIMDVSFDQRSVVVFVPWGRGVIEAIDGKVSSLRVEEDVIASIDSAGMTEIVIITFGA